MGYSFKNVKLYFFLNLEDFIQEGDEYLTNETGEMQWKPTTLTSGLTQVKNSVFNIYSREVKQEFVRMENYNEN